MTGLGTIVNIAAILIGGTMGLGVKKFLSECVTDTVMQGVGLAVIIIGISGALSAAYTVVDSRLSSGHILIMIISLATGALIGELLKLEDKLEAFADFCERKMNLPAASSGVSKGNPNVAEAKRPEGRREFTRGSMNLPAARLRGIRRIS